MDIVITITGLSSEAETLITDNAVIENITNDSSWSTGEYLGTSAGLKNGNYYIDNNKNIMYKYLNSKLIRITINQPK